MLGGKATDMGWCSEYNVECVWIDMGNVLIELINDVGKGEIVKKFIEKKGEGLHHIAVIKKGLKSDIRGALEGMKINFLDLKKTNGVLIEEVDFDGI